MRTSLQIICKYAVLALILSCTALLNISYGQYLPDLIYYKFDKNTSTTSIQNFAYPGVGSNPATFTGLAINSGGQFDSCLFGNATSSAKITTGYNMVTGTSSFTISMWLSNIPTAPASTRYLFGDGGLSFRCFIGGTAGNNNIIIRGTGMNDVLIKNIAPGPVVLHIVYDSASTSIKTYKNGVADTVVTQSALNLTAGTGFTVGGYGSNAGMQGVMDEFRFYKRALTASEISASYNMPVEMPNYYNLKTGTSGNSFPFNQASGKAINNIFLAGDFSQPTSAPSWHQINTVYFRMATAGTRTYTDLRILMTQTSSTALPSGAFYSGPYDTVYYRSSVSLTSYVGGWMSLTLDKPFIYDASKSLVMLVGQCGSTGTGGSIYNSSISGIRRVYSVSGCPYTISAAGDAAVSNFGFDVTPTSLSGNYYIPSGNFPTIASAVNAVNNCTISGPVTFNVAAGYTENTTSPILLTGTGTSSNTITFKKYGTGLNPVVSRTDTGTVTTTTAGGQGDGVIIIQGSDYVTFEGINVSASSFLIEYGYYIRKANVNDGCKNVYLKNLSVTMTKGTSANVTGIYLSNNDSASLPSSTTGITVASIDGRNENIYITGDTISNVHTGIIVRGYNHASPYDFYDQNIVIGQSDGGNVIKNFGGGSSSTAYGVYLIYQTSPNISYNIINNATEGANATGTIYGILMSTSSAGGNFISNNNTITLGISATSGAHCIYNNQTCTSITINNNTFGYGTFASTTASYIISCSNSTPDITVTGNKTTGTISKTGAGQLAGYYNNGSPASGTAIINNNNFSNITLTGASTFYGIRQTTSISQVFNINNNTISNITGGSSSLYGIYNGYGATGNTISGDTINNLSGSGAVYGIYCGLTSAPTSLSVNGNIINNLSSSGASTVYGINSAYGTANSFFQNKIYNLTSSNASGVVNGMTLSNGTATYVYNNYLSDFKTPLGNAAISIVGVNITGGTSAYLYYNTVFLNALSSGVTFGSTGIYANTSVNLELINNIIINTSIPSGTGITTAYRRTTNTLTSYSSSSNNNCFYAGTPSASNLLLYDGTNSIQTIGDFRTLLTPRDASSFTEIPPFTDTTVTPYNLHLKTTDTTQCEKGGIPITTPIAVTNDFDGNTRNSSRPDVGADEFSGIPDFPNIAYANLPNTTSTSNYVTSNWANIRDITGINTVSGIAPRLYYRKSSNENTFIDNTSSTNGWKWVSSSNTSSPFDFTIDYSKLYGGSVVNGDKIFYFIVAQDILGVPNVSAKSATFASAPVSVDLTSSAFPIGGAVNYYMISTGTPLSGTYTVSLSLFNLVSGKNLVSKEFTRKTGKELVNDSRKIAIENSEDAVENISESDVTIEINEIEEKYFALSENGKEYKGSTYIEFTPEIRKKYNLPDSYTGTYANISGAVGDLNSVGVSSAVTFLLLDVNYGDSGTPEDFPITINQFSGASVSSTVTFKPNTGITSTIAGLSSSSIFKLNGADYVIIDGSNSGGSDKNLTIQNTNASSSTAAIWFSSSGASLGSTYDTIRNCNIMCNFNTGVSYGVSVSGTSLSGAGADNDYIAILNNNISKTYYGIYAYGNSTGEVNSISISGNTIGSSNASDYVTYYGIYGNYLSAPIVTNNEIYNMIYDGNKYGLYFSSNVSNSLISKNKIHGFNHTNTTNYYCIGIYFASSTGCTNNQIDNNVIYDLLNYGSTSDYYLCGIRIAGGSGYKLYNNSISLTGAFRNTTAGVYSKCLYVSSASTGLDIRNNIFYNAMSGTTPKTYTVDIVSSSTLTNCNYNDYYTTGTVLGRYAGVEVANLSAWKTSTSQDTFSLSANPGFTSNTDLSINTNSAYCWNINGGAYPLASVPTDIAGNPRSSNLNTGSADIGAYEFTPAVTAPNLTVTGLPPSDGNNSTILFAGNTLAIITWHIGSGTLPTNITAVFRPQVNPPNPSGSYANENLQITATGGSGYTYDIVYYYNLARKYTIVNESDIRLAKYDAAIGWEQYTTTPNATLKNITVTDINTQFSTFSLGDNNNPLPVQMKSFTSNVNGRNVKLNWITEKEINSRGFEIQRAFIQNSNIEFAKVGFINSLGSNPKPNSYSFEDKKLNSGKYKYRLKQIDFNGNYTFYNLDNDIEIALPKNFNLSQNYPNPFNPSTKIDFELPFDSRVRMVIFDMLGREVKTLIPSELKLAGFYTVDINANNFSSGTYFYRMIANSQGKDYIFTKKMIIVK